MDLNAVLLVLFFSYLFVCQDGVQGVRELSAREDLELENQLKLLNKPAVKTIHTEYGDIYDCVDFYKQPAFDHPLLKNHSFYFGMKPTPLLRSKGDQVRSKVRESVNMKLKDGGCPVGTVPIRRIMKEDLIRERNVSNIGPLDEYAFGAHYAFVRTKADAGKFYGAGATLSLHNPKVLQNQYSASRFKVQNGLEEIQVGWRVDPGLYGDTRTRGFIRVDAGQSHCFNTRCPGFVLVKRDTVLDEVFDHNYVYGGPSYEIQRYIKRDRVTGDWWLFTGRTGLGFWPKKIFSELAESASYLEWGGKVYSPPGTTAKPEMGSGHDLQLNPKYDAYMNIGVFNDQDQYVDTTKTEIFFDDVALYDVADAYKKDHHVVFYGGPRGPL